VHKDYQAIQAQFAKHLRDPDGCPPPPGIPEARVAVYSTAVFLAQRSLFADNFPSLVRLYDAAGWDALVRAYLREHAAHSPNFIDVPQEFYRYLSARAAEGRDDPPYLVEMADFECLETRIGGDMRRHDLSGVDPDGDLLRGMPRVNPIREHVAYRYPVHQITPENRAQFDPPNPAPAAPTHIIAFRTVKNRFRFIDVNPLTLELLDRLSAPAPRTGEGVLRELAAERGMDAEQVCAFGGDILKRMHAVGLILGIAKLELKP